MITLTVIPLSGFITYLKSKSSNEKNDEQNVFQFLFQISKWQRDTKVHLQSNKTVGMRPTLSVSEILEVKIVQSLRRLS
jgi:hypothetical protein